MRISDWSSDVCSSDLSGKTLSSRLGPEQLKAYQAAMASVGLPAAQFDMFEPWFPAITLSVLPLTKLGYDPEQGAEKLLTGSSEEHTSELQSLMRITYAVSCLNKKQTNNITTHTKLKNI